MTPPTIQNTFNLAYQHHQAGRLNEAELLYRQILSVNPQHVDSLHLLGLIAHQMGQHGIAADLIRQALAVDPNFAEAHSNLGNVLLLLGDLDGAVDACRRAIAIKPDFADAYMNLGGSLKAKGSIEEAVAAYQRTTALQPNNAKGHYNLGAVLRIVGRPDEAIAAYQRAIQLDPEFPEAFDNLGLALADQGLLREAIDAFRRAVALRPGYTYAHSNLVFYLQYDPEIDAPALARELRQWNQQHAEPLRAFIKPHTNDRDPNRRLRVGYVSPDFRDHPVARFLLPLLENHDRSQVEVFGYAQVPVPDSMTGRLRSYTDAWRTLVGLSDASAADLIRDDRIDILVDLTLHASDNRLLVFARKPAPLQVTYLAYPGSSGLSTIDYRLSDPYLDPPGTDTSVYSERTIRLPQTYWCYQGEQGPSPGLPPACIAGFITFGCVNNFCKINPPLMALWASVLRTTANSRLLMHAHEGGHRQRVLEQLRQHGIDSQRVSFVGTKDRAAYFDLYHSIDIGLDTSPFTGGTTTCDALWMGVPVVSLKGKTAVGRGGSSILSNVGLAQLVAETPEQYVQLATDLAGDLPRLTQLRSTLRQRMQASPLMDAPTFAKNVEASYRTMWRTWCESQ